MPVFDRLEFVLSEAITALRRNGWMTIASINTAAVALLIFGGLGYTYVMLVNHLNTLPAVFELTLSVKEEAGDADSPAIQQMAEDLRAIDGVAEVVFLPSEAEWEKILEDSGMRELVGDLPNVMENQFQVTLTDLEKAESVKQAIMRHPHYDSSSKIRDAQEERELFVKVSHFVRLIGLLLSSFTLFTAGVLILNTVHLTVLARRQEIRIMRMGGASHGMIRWPFLIEGAAQGGFGGIMAGLALWAISGFIAGYTPLGGDSGAFPVAGMTVTLAIIGVALGMLAAGLSVRKYLRVQT